MTPRYGVIGDVHANLAALSVALAALERAGVDRILVTGDLVGYGPQPNECIERIASLDALCVAGNHDLIVLGELSDARCIPLARDSLRWTKRVLTEDSRSFLKALPQRVATKDGVVIAHGSLGDPEEYVTTSQQAARELGRLAEESPGARCLLLGHTHRPAAFDADGRRLAPRLGGTVALARSVLLNPGAVGQSREFRARVRVLILDLERSEAHFAALPYDVAACRRLLRRCGLSPRGCHLRPSPVRAGVRRLRRLKALWPGAKAAEGVR